MKKDPIKINTIENANAIVRGKEIPNGQLDMVICDPPQYSNINDKLLNNWKNKEEYYQWFDLYMNIVAMKLKRTGIFFLTWLPRPSFTFYFLLFCGRCPRKRWQV